MDGVSERDYRIIAEKSKGLDNVPLFELDERANANKAKGGDDDASAGAAG